MLLRQFSKFFVVGGIGFGVDAGVLYLLLAHLGPYYSRIISFLIAVLATWLLNRHFVFSKTQNSAREGISYFTVQGIGFLINFVIYSCLVYQGLIPFMALVFASALALFWNFSGAKFLVFKEKK
jgi:putative flippase GtrA